jgi:MHS family proline/betaine transporter-like MFS transporter
VSSTNISQNYSQAYTPVSRLPYRALAFGTIASAFEWYDYALFGYFASIIGAQFFPTSDPISSLLASFGVFASGFAMRPLGSIFFGYIGDRIGRKSALLASLMMMAVPTMVLGMLPNYEAVGIWSSIGLVVIRLFQGLAVGGNYGGSFIYTIEHASANQRGLAGSLAAFGTLGGLLLGSGIAAFMAAILPASELNSYGWRIPFILGGLSGLIGYLIRNKVPDLAFHATKDVLTTNPLPVIAKQHLANLLKSMGIILLDGVGVYIVFVFMTTFASVFLGLPEDKVLLINTLAMFMLVITIPFFGWLGDKASQRLILKGVSLGFLVLSLPLFGLLISFPSIKTLIILQISFSVLMGAVYGTVPALISSAFPPSVRYTASGLAFNISVAVFGGTSPFLVTTLIHKSGWLLMPAALLTIVGAISGICVMTLLSPKEK